MSMPACAASRLASGDANTRCSVDGRCCVTGFGASLLVSAGFGASGAGFGASAFAAGFASAFTASLIDCIAAGMSEPLPGFSPSPSSTAIGWLTFTPSVPSGTRILPIRPSSTASNSIVALSVSISARMSPEWTSSPSLTSHLASLPSSIVGDSAGMRICVAIRQFPPAAAATRRYAAPNSCRRNPSSARR